MCDICRCNPCDSRCPNAERQKIFCMNCDELITDNDEPYMDDLGNEFCCLECALNYHGIEKE